MCIAHRQLDIGMAQVEADNSQGHAVYDPTAGCCVAQVVVVGVGQLG